MFSYLFQQISSTLVIQGANDQTMEFQWITEEGRLRMIGALNDSVIEMNMTTIA